MNHNYIIKFIISYLVAVVISTSAICTLSANQDSPTIEQLDFANGLFRRGMYRMAINEYKKFIELNPYDENLHQAYFGIAESNYFAKSYEDAVAAYRKYIELFPEGERASISKVRIGEAFFFGKRYDEALNTLLILEKEIEDYNLSLAVYFYIAKAFKTKGNIKEAHRYYTMVIRRAKTGEYAFHSLFELGELASSDSGYAKALNYFSKAHRAAYSDETRILALYQVAQMQFSSGDYTASADTFSDIVKTFPESETAPSALANFLLSLFNTGRYKDVTTEYAKAKAKIGDEGPYFDIHFVAACAYAEVEDYDEALSIIDTLSTSRKAGQDNLNKAALKRVEILLKSKRFEDALKVIDSDIQGLKINRDHALFFRGEALYGLERFSEASAVYEEVIEEFADSELRLDATYSLAYTKKVVSEDEEASQLFLDFFNQTEDDPRRQIALYNTILLYIKLGNLQEAQNQSKVFLDKFEGSDLRPKVLFKLGSVHSEMKEYDEAVKIYKRLIDLSKDGESLDDVHFLIGYNLQLSRRYKEALGYYKKIGVKKGSDGLYASALKNMALIYFLVDDKPKAAEIYDRITTEISPEALDIEAYIWLGRYYSNNKRFNDALRIIDVAPVKGAETEKGKELVYIKAEAYRSLGDPEKAIEHYNTILSGERGNVFSGAAHIGKGICLMAKKEFDSARAEFDIAIVENTDDNTITMRARFETAAIESVSGNFEEASKLYMLVAILYEDDNYCPKALFRAGENFQAIGKTQEAKKAYEELVVQYSKDPLADRARDKLAKINRQ